MRPPATKGNKKENKLGDKIEDKTSWRHTIQHQGGHLKKTLRTPNSTLFEKKCKIRPPATTRNKKKDKLGDKLGDKKEDKLGDKQGDKGYKTSGRRTPHPTQAHMWGDNGRQEETRRREGGHTIQHRHACGETVGDNGRQGRNPKKNRHTITGTHVGRQRETKRGHKTSRRRTHHPTQARVCGDNWRQWETIGSMGGDKTWERRTHHPTRADKGRQDLGKANTPSKTCRHTCGETMGDKKGRQDVGKADAPSNTGTRVWRQLETMGDNWFNRRRQDLGKADTPSNTGRQGETRPREDEHTIQNMQAHMWGDNGRQKGKTRRREGGRTIQQRHTCGETMGNSGWQGREKTSRRQTHHPGTHVGRQREISGDKRQDQGGHLKNALRTPRAAHWIGEQEGR